MQPTLCNSSLITTHRELVQKQNDFLSPWKLQLNQKTFIHFLKLLRDFLVGLYGGCWWILTYHLDARIFMFPLLHSVIKYLIIQRIGTLPRFAAPVPICLIFSSFGLHITFTAADSMLSLFVHNNSKIPIFNHSEVYSF